MPTPLYSIVIPCHNHGRECVATIEGIVRALNCGVADLEILVVIDGCTDDTAAIVHSMAQAYSMVRVIEQDRRLGKGGAVRSGMLLARGAYVAFIDADNVIDPSFLPTFFGAIERGEADIVVARRVSYDTSLLRTVASHAYRCMNRVLFGMPIVDTQAGLKAFRGSLVANLFRPLTVRGYAFDVELLCRAYLERLRILDLPVMQTRCDKSNMTLHATLRALVDTLRTAVSFRMLPTMSAWQRILKNVLLPPVWCVLHLLESTLSVYERFHGRHAAWSPESRMGTA